MPDGAKPVTADKVAKNTEHPNLNVGRKKGVLNKTTAISRECFAKLVEGNWHKMQGWLDKIAEDEKTGAKDALDRMLIMAEFCVPKLARTELVTDKDSGLKVIVNRADSPASE